MHQLLNANRIKTAIRNAKSERRELWLSDNQGTRGTGRLVVRVSPFGVVRFYYRPSRSNDSSSQAIPIGAYSRVRREGHMTLTEARRRATELSRSIPMRAVDYLADLISPPIASSPKLVPLPTTKGPATPATLLQLCRAYAQKLEDDGKSSAREVKGAIERHINPSILAHVLARDISSRDFTDFFRKMCDADQGGMAQRIRSHLHAAYALALRAHFDPTTPATLKDFGVESNPLANVSSMSQFKKARNRCLRDSELREVWKRLQNDRGLTIPKRGARLCLLLGGQRAEQLCAVTVHNVDLEANTILLLDGKGNRRVPSEHLLPLCAQARIDVQWLMDYAKSVRSDHLLPGSVRGTVLNSSSISDAVKTIRLDMEKNGLCESQFSFIDFRRTIETKLAQLGVSKDYRAQIQSHGLSGVQNKHYDKHDYMPEKTNVLTLWEKFLSNLLPESR